MKLRHLPFLLVLAGLPLALGAAFVHAQTQNGQVLERLPCDERLTTGASLEIACLRLLYAQPTTQWPAPHIDTGVAWKELATLPSTPPAPADNPATPEKIALGRKLFEDPRLSLSGQIACANCHDRQLGWSDGRSVSFGHDRQRGRRNSMGLAMSGYATSLFWDGRSSSLEEQALHPIEDAKEMAFTSKELERRLNRDSAYRNAFARVFGVRRIQTEQIAQALATFQRSLAPRNSRLDRFLAGRRDLLNDQELQGLHLFRTRARCMNCHNGATLSDDKFHNLGLHFRGRELEDLGRYEVTGMPGDSGTFRTPSLRGVSRSGPWMHNGTFPQLRGIVNFYNAGGAHPRPKPDQLDDPLFPKTDPLLKPLQLNKDERAALVAFLEAL
ncbi:cytochrome-c peroxidase [Pseudoxanthomonas mexicana]|uniref:Methylamine utilization protein MauG n=1 Tax=Pseudoxanthomonas mexicana TaxID=128785 RepID=A0A7G9T9L4_PSEMX|nr:cytochrome c peroxidase [Pseudoxanthomonas mexicana]QNN76789.1 cytochrome-c peroxidase [Pseudoxanthomonas mexicana]